MTTVLLRLLETRFGAVPDEIVDRIQGAPAGKIVLWAERVVAPLCQHR